MIQISDLKALVQSETYQKLAKELTQKYNLNVQEENSLQGWNIDCQMLNASGLSLAEINAYFVENAELIGILLSEREKKTAGDGYFMQSIFLSTSANLMLLQNKPLLMDYFKKIRMPAPTKVAKEYQHEYETALAILKGEEPPQPLEPKTKKTTKNNTQKVHLSEFSKDKNEAEQTAKANIWGKQTLIIVDDEVDDIPLQKIEKWLTWVEENRSEIIDFALDAEGFVDNFNGWVEQEIGKKGKAKLFDGTILTELVAEETIRQSISISSIWVELDDETVESLSLDLITTPDYFGGHSLDIEIDNRKKLFFGGMNG